MEASPGQYACGKRHKFGTNRHSLYFGLPVLSWSPSLVASDYGAYALPGQRGPLNSDRLGASGSLLPSSDLVQISGSIIHGGASQKEISVYKPTISTQTVHDPRWRTSLLPT